MTQPFVLAFEKNPMYVACVNAHRQRVNFADEQRRQLKEMGFGDLTIKQIWDAGNVTHSVKAGKFAHEAYYHGFRADHLKEVLDYLGENPSWEQVASVVNKFKFWRLQSKVPTFHSSWLYVGFFKMVHAALTFRSGHMK